MRAALQIQSGSLRQHTIQLEAGQSVRVGRTSLADFVVAEDQHMSGIHFVLECDEQGCLLRTRAAATELWSTDAR